MQRMASLALITLAVSACAVSKVDPLTVPLAYNYVRTPNAALQSPACSSLAGVQVNDKRTDKSLGVRYHESKALKAEVTAGTDPARWIQFGVEGFLNANGVKITSQGPALILNLESLRTSENIYHRSGYEARIQLGAALKSPSGKVCWQESQDGKAGNYGYSGSIENYQETLNSALDVVTAHMLNTASFTAALCHCAE